MHIKFTPKGTYNLTSEGFVNDLQIGNYLVKEPLQQLAVATSSGKILIIVNGQVKATLNPKSGSILSLSSGPLTSQRPINLISGDSSGQITFFLGSQMVSKVQTSQPIQSLAFVSDIAGNHEIVSGSSLGHLAGYHLHNRLWRTTLNASSIKTGGVPEFLPLPASQPISCIVTASIADEARLAKTNYSFTVNGTRDVHMFSGQHLVLVIQFPKPIITGCKGRFREQSLSDSDDLIFASREGQVYILGSGFKPQEYATCSYSINQLLAYRPKGLSITDPSLLVIVGLSDLVFFFHNGLLVQELQVSDWVSKAAVGDLSDQLLSGQNPLLEAPNLAFNQRELGHFIVFALADSTVHIFAGSVF